MKARNGFVSNSSSSSFIINIGDLSAQQLYWILENKEMRENCDEYDRWEIEADEFTVRGSTSMDNYSMSDYLYKIGVNMDKVRWGD